MRHLPIRPALWSLGTLAITLTGFGHQLRAQDDGFNFAVHANSHVTPADIGLPAFPGAALNTRDGSDAAFDLGFTVGQTQFRLQGVSYVTDAPPSEVLAFYRDPLSRYGEVLECDHGRPVGSVTRTHSGLTCDDDAKARRHVNGHSAGTDGRELRAGSPQAFRLMAVDASGARSTQFVLMRVVAPARRD